MSMEQIFEKLQACNIDVQKGLENDTGNGQEYLNALKRFVNSYDFMRLGQAINSGRFESAMMACRRMTQESEKLGLTCYSRQFAGLRQNIARKDSIETKNILSLMIRKRIQIQNVLKEL